MPRSKYRSYRSTDNTNFIFVFRLAKIQSQRVQRIEPGVIGLEVQDLMTEDYINGDIKAKSKKVHTTMEGKWYRRAHKRNIVKKGGNEAKRSSRTHTHTDIYIYIYGVCVCVE